jgi:transmembrane sensor
VRERKPLNTAEESASVWVARLDRGLSPAEQEALDAWVDADPRHAGALARAQALWMHSDLVKPGRSDAQTARMVAPKRTHLVVRGAAAAGLILCSAITLLGWTRYADTHLTTAVGEIRHVPLPDGSSVTLDTASRITVAYDREIRRIRLDRGEALFDVAHDARRPFLVEAGALRVRAVGTAFMVRRDDAAHAEVTVTRGIVDVWRNTSVLQAPVRLAAGRRATATAETLQAPQALSEAQVTRDTAWQMGVLDLEGRTLAEAASEFNRYNHQHVVIADPALAEQRVIGRFSVSDPVGFATAAAAMLGAHLQMQDDQITVQAGEK